ncbi:MAG: polyprenyl synthetase family protein [Myxococcota bacterium]
MALTGFGSAAGNHPPGEPGLAGEPVSRRHRPAGLAAGAPGVRVSGPERALGLVAAELAEAELELRTLVRTDVAAVERIGRYLIDAGGKRLRPALTALGARAVGTNPAPVRLMCVGELLHLGSLLHDDVVDDGDVRRDQPAAHRVYGNAVTVLTGDFCLARAVLLASEAGGPAAVHALGQVVTEMAEGEVLQLNHAGDLGCTIDQYLDVVARKSAALIAWCVRAEALARGYTAHAAALERFGRQIGIAFQITDDVLDYAEGTGKLRGADLRERKVTLPLILAMDALPGLREELAEGPPSPSRVEHWLARIRGTDALDRALDHARERVEGAIDALGSLPPGEGRDALSSLARYLVERVR